MTLLTLATLVVGLFAAGTAAWLAAAQVSARERAYDEQVTSSLASEVQSRVRLAEGYSLAIAAFYTANKQIRHDEFRDFAQKLNIIPAVSAVQLIRAVPHRDLDAFIEQQRRTHGPAYRIADRTPDLTLQAAAERALYMPIEAVYPLAGNDQVIGLDVTSDLNSVDAIKRSLAGNQVATTPGFKLLQSPNDSAFLLYSALRNQQTGELAGAAAVVITFPRLLEGVGAERATIASIIGADHDAPFFGDAQPGGPPLLTKELMVGDRNWQLGISVSKDSSPIAAGLLVFGLGTLLTLLALGGMDLAHLQMQNRLVGKTLSEREQSLEARESAYTALFYNSATANAEIDSVTFRILRANAVFEELTGFPARELAEIKLLDLVSAEDRRKVEAALGAVGRSNAKASQLECRVRSKTGADIWVLASIGSDTSASVAQPRLSLVMQDISKRMEVEQTRDLLVRELAHRLRNTMQLVTSLAEQTGRSSRTAEEYHRNLRGRLRALNIAQDALFETNWSPVRLDILAQRVLEPFQGDRNDDRISIDVAPTTLTAQQSQTIALALHELASNAAQHGALRGSGGAVNLQIALSHEANENGVPNLNLQWVEYGSDTAYVAPARSGFGSIMLQQLLARQYGGSARYDWQPDRMTFTAQLPLRDEIS